MEKILILTYSFPPCNLTASQRVKGWAKYLAELGYYPVIITRNWDVEITTPQDAYASAGQNIVHEVHENYEVYFMPYRSNLSGKMYMKFGDEKLRFIRKFFTFSELILQNFFTSVIPYNNIYSFAKKYLHQHRDIKKVLITANPFIMFKFGYLLSKKAHVKWVADYRDDWTTDELKVRKTLFEKMLLKIDRKKELKWVGTANLITTVSDNYLQKILRLFPDSKGAVIYNGYLEEDAKYKNSSDKKKFIITFNGTLYVSQPVEIFLEALKTIIDLFAAKLEIKILFPGLAYNATQANRVAGIMRKYPGNIVISGRIERDKVLKMQAESQLLLMIAHTNIKGVPSSKLFEYIGLHKPILVCPGDMDIIDKLVTETGLGIICNTSNELINKLKWIINRYLETGEINVKPDSAVIANYSRYEQVKKLAGLLDKL